jgi:hypothetical protein
MAAGSAAASTGPAKHSPAEAGYAATGARFKEAEISVRLPDASRFASEIGRLSFSVQLWAASAWSRCHAMEHHPVPRPASCDPAGEARCSAGSSFGGGDRHLQRARELFHLVVGTSPGQDDQQWQFRRGGGGWPASPVEPRVQLQHLPGAVTGERQPGRHRLGTAGAMLGTIRADPRVNPAGGQNVYHFVMVTSP